jgi:phage shock protein PspC (stress-responsive transcriptional regulator)
MKKTISCNISGLIFNIEEPAYNRLSAYLDSLKNQLSHTEGKDEIYADIELRIAELFTEKLGATRQVVTEEDVNEVIAILGKPEDYIDEEETTFQKEEFSTSQQPKKQFMRDTDNALIGGVCGGISAYFGIDLTLVRAIFVLLFFLTGFGFMLYIVLWIITPKANTRADKLRMQGKPITVDTIIAEVQDASERIEKAAKSKKTQEQLHRVKEKSSGVAKAFGRIIGLFLIIGSAFGIIAFLTVTLTGVGIFTSDDGEQLLSLYEFSDIIFRSSLQSFLGWTGLMAVVLIPLITLLVLGVSLLLHIRSFWAKYTLLSLLIMWFVGLGMMMVVGFQLAREFNHEAEYETKIGTVNANELTIVIPETGILHSGKSKITVNGEDMGDWLSIEGEEVKSGFVNLKLTASPDSQFHIIQETSSHGITPKKAMNLANEVRHEIKLDSNSVEINPYYFFPASSKLRGQSVTIYIQVPEHGKINWNGNKKLVNIDRRSREITFDHKKILIEID